MLQEPLCILSAALLFFVQERGYLLGKFLVWLAKLKKVDAKYRGRLYQKFSGISWAKLVDYLFHLPYNDFIYVKARHG